MQDPFDEVKSSVTEGLAQVRHQLAAWPASGYSPEAARRARSALGTIAADIQDLAETVAVVERDPARFRLTLAEVQARRMFVSTVKNNQQFIEDETGKQALMMRQQDQQLDAVMNTATTLKEIAITMGDEIEDQIGLMADMENEVDTTQDKLRGTLRKLDVILKASEDTKATWLIVILTIVLVLLIVFVLV
ncbi:hypothetical protein H9P43_007887 [Blastocladiella emersonii ATCC 22665]|nr:hypothetical protein H9P43_007887 [Blastocladiella emersonii ATCC 22665]